MYLYNQERINRGHELPTQSEELSAEPEIDTGGRN